MAEGTTPVSVVVPLLNELETLRQQQEYFATLENRTQLIFVDGGSSDGSLEWLKHNGSRVISSPPGRATQMNAGAGIASGDLLLFHHVDSRLPSYLDDALDRVNPVSGWGYFALRLSGRHWLFRCIEKGINLRSKLTRIASGDQCIFVARALFEQLGGYADIPLMEDIELCRRLRKCSAPRRATGVASTSSRRWEQRGILRTVLLMWWLQIAYRCGAKPKHLAARYR